MNFEKRAILVILASLFICTAAFADGGVYWQQNGVLVCDSTRRGIVTIISDAKGGAIIGWRDDRNYYSVYAQRVDSNGNMVWALNGVPVCQDGTVSLDADISCIADDNGGAIFCWTDYVHMDSLQNKVFVQKIDSTGAAYWGSNGMRVAFSDSDQVDQSICSDGAGGCIVTWLDLRNANSDIFAQRIDSTGTRLWGNGGIPICTEINPQAGQMITSLSDTGAVIVWGDLRYGDYDVFGQRIDENGATFWGNNGKPIRLDSGRQVPRGIVNNGRDGVILVWESGDFIIYDIDIYGQKLDANGDVCWDSNGVVICDEDSVESSSKIVSDGKAGIIAVWLDERTSVQWDVYCQRVDSNGICMWDSNGIFIYTIADTSQEPTDLYPQICSDGRSGGIVTSKVYGNSNWDIYCQRIDSLGVVQWGAGGLPVCVDSLYQRRPVITTDKQGGAIIAWGDYRNIASVYAQRVGDVVSTKEKDRGYQASHPRLFCFPNPFTTVTRIQRMNASDAKEATLTIYDSAGRLVKSVKLATSTYQLGADLVPGIYFLKLNGTPVGKVVKVR
jgi:hypothetical protein